MDILRQEYCASDVWQRILLMCQTDQNILNIKRTYMYV